ncbi:MAG TPA: carboxypeptidase-like regulatory domain-containing protein [Bryobacteraceae bacterium]|nr:carboxypeptidase-like regulatory domain-containing protein [Bryobacteraceae bacterium]
MRLEVGLSRIARPPAAIAAFWICTAVSSFAQSAAPGTIQGTVIDPSGSVVASAVVNLQRSGSAERTTITDRSGSLHFSGVDAGTYNLTVIALGFSEYKSSVTVVSGENPPLPPITLVVAPAISQMNVTLPPHELAAAQVHQEEKQRVLGVFPNFFVTYQSNAAPLTAAQKFQLGWREIIDPEVLISTGLIAGIEQARNSYPEFGQGSEGFGKRLGAAYADRVSGVFIGHVVTHAIFHQDPRYFYKSTGAFRSRFLYAVGTAFVRKGDNGHWQPDYSDVIGGLASGEISTLYYPASSRMGLRLFHSVLLGFGGRAASHLLQQFVYRSFSTHVPKFASRLQPVVPKGLPVSLISVQDLRSTTPQTPRTVTFILAKDISVDGVIVAKAGAHASGQVSYSGSAAAMHLSLEDVSLQIGNIEVPLRSSPGKNGTAALDFHWVEDTGRIAVVLYSARNVTLAPVH